MKTTFLLTLSVFFISACGKKMESTTKHLNVYESFEVGEFRAILRPLNNHLNGWIPNGMANLSVSKYEFKIQSWLDDSANVTHRQFVTTASRCPTVKDDLNGDGFIDFKEAMQSKKRILIPLDNNLSMYSEENPQFPRGNFNYELKIALNKLQLPKDVGLNLFGKAVIILGTGPSKVLPNSVSTFENASPELSIPIACGIIEKVL